MQWFFKHLSKVYILLLYSTLCFIFGCHRSDFLRSKESTPLKSDPLKAGEVNPFDIGTSTDSNMKPIERFTTIYKFEEKEVVFHSLIEQSNGCEGSKLKCQSIKSNITFLEVYTYINKSLEGLLKLSENNESIYMGIDIPYYDDKIHLFECSKGSITTYSLLDMFVTCNSHHLKYQPVRDESINHKDRSFINPCSAEGRIIKEGPKIYDPWFKIWKQFTETSTIEPQNQFRLHYKSLYASTQKETLLVVKEVPKSMKQPKGYLCGAMGQLIDNPSFEGQIPLEEFVKISKKKTTE